MIIERFRNWKESKTETYTWISYRIFGRISNYVSDNTNYSEVLKSADVKDSTRYYFSKVLMSGLILWFLLSILSNILVIPSSWISGILGLSQTVVSLTSIPVIITEIIGQILRSTSFIIEVGNQADIQSITDRIVNTLEDVGRNVRFIGAILFVIATVIEAVFDPIISIGSDLLGSINAGEVSSGSSGSQDNVLKIIGESIGSISPDRGTIRNLIIIIIAPLLSLGYICFKILWPYYISNERGRQIDNDLARSYTFMHALSAGGLGLYESMEKLASAEDAYGEVSVSFQKIVRKANKGGDGSLSSAVSEVAEETPSEELRSFLEGLTNTIQTGSDVNRYIQTRAERALDDARDEQENRLSLYELISEGYIIIFVASPIFFLVLQLVQAMVGSVSRGTTEIVPYLMIPVGGGMIMFIVYITGKKDEPSFTELDIGESSVWYDINQQYESSDYDPKISRKISVYLRSFWSKVRSSLTHIKQNPKLTLIITLPIAIITILIGVQLGYIPISGTEGGDGTTGSTLMETIDQKHLGFTIFLIYLPFIIIATPWMILYELKRRKRRKVLSQLPQLFSDVAEANKRGLTLQESLETVASSSDDPLHNNLQESIRQSKITGDLNGALIQFANKMRVPRLSQSVRLLVEANKVSSNVTVVVEKISEDLESKYGLIKDRKQRARVYLIIVFVAFFIGSGVLIALDVTFFGFISGEIGAGDGGASSNTSAQSSSQSAQYGQDLPVEFFRRVFLHTLMALAIVSGMVAGMMENGKPTNGLKYAIAMVTLALIAFVTIPIIFG